MPINIPNLLPAKLTMENENIFVMTQERALKQEIRPLRILLFNLMPTKIDTETQIIRLIGNTPIQVELEFLQTASYTSKNTAFEHLSMFYKTFDEIKGNRYDGMIITGAPVEHMDFEQVTYWNELCRIIEWAKHNVFSTFHICWGAQAGLFYHYGIKKCALKEKMFGIFSHTTSVKSHPLLRGFDEVFLAPHSRYTTILEEDILKIPELELLSVSEEAGVYLVSSKDHRQVFVTGHSEYERNTLANEYFRDLEKGLSIQMPVNYFPNNDPKMLPVITWRSHANLLFSNWLNYYVYQSTPYDLKEL